MIWLALAEVYTLEYSLVIHISVIDGYLTSLFIAGYDMSNGKLMSS